LQDDAPDLERQNRRTMVAIVVRSTPNKAKVIGFPIRVGFAWDRRRFGMPAAIKCAALVVDDLPEWCWRDHQTPSRCNLRFLSATSNTGLIERDHLFNKGT